MPVRMCAGCRKRAEKADLIRIVISPDGAAADFKAILPGRGAYVCRGAACLEAALKNGGLNRGLKKNNIAAVSGLEDEKE